MSVRESSLQYFTLFHKNTEQSPADGILTLTEWWGLRGQRIQKAMLAVV
jgi:hypothetical protein